MAPADAVRPSPAVAPLKLSLPHQPSTTAGGANHGSNPGALPGGKSSPSANTSSSATDSPSSSSSASSSSSSAGDAVAAAGANPPSGWPDARGTPPHAARKAPPSSSSVSSPTSRDADDERDVDALLEGIDRVRIDDLWSTPRSARADAAAAGSMAGALKTPSKAGTDGGGVGAVDGSVGGAAAVDSRGPGGRGGMNGTPGSAGSLQRAVAGQQRFRAGLFAPPGESGIAAIAAASPASAAKRAAAAAAAEVALDEQKQQAAKEEEEERRRTIMAAAARASAAIIGAGRSGAGVQGRDVGANVSEGVQNMSQGIVGGDLGGFGGGGGMGPRSKSSPVGPMVQRLGSHRAHQHHHGTANHPPVAMHPMHSFHAGMGHVHQHGEASGACAIGCGSGWSAEKTPVDVDADFPRLFKVFPCPNPQACLTKGEQAECFYYHSPSVDRRRGNYALYKPHMCRFVEEAGGCRKGDRCPFSHNDFERRYHPDRFGKETCRDFLRGDCPRRYCTFKHEVSGKVEVALTQMDSMNDKELLQLVLKISDAKGRALSEKLLRRFGNGKKHSGWRLEGFSTINGRDDARVKLVSARVETLRKLLRSRGEKKWATSLKTTSLRDMMSGVRKVAEEVRERHRDDHLRGDNGPELHRLIRAVFSNTNWSCHSQEGDNPFLVTPDNQSDAITALERLVEMILSLHVSNGNTSVGSGGGVGVRFNVTGAGTGDSMFASGAIPSLNHSHSLSMSPSLGSGSHAPLQRAHSAHAGYSHSRTYQPMLRHSQVTQHEQGRRAMSPDMGPVIPDMVPGQTFYQASSWACGGQGGSAQHQLQQPPQSQNPEQGGVVWNEPIVSQLY